jgi:hypothetical protein
MEVNKGELIHHESTVCEYRKVQCHSCKKLEQDVKEMKEKLEDMAGIKEDVDQVKALLVQMFEKLNFLENSIQISSAINHASNTLMELMEDIVIAGGYNSRDNVLKSVERFSWENSVWKRVSSMSVGRVGATSFVYENQLFVAGGCDSDVIEVLNLNEDQLRWDEYVATLPNHCEHLRSVVYQNRVVFFLRMRSD